MTEHRPGYGGGLGREHMAIDKPTAMTAEQITELAARLFVAYKQMGVGGTATDDITVSKAAIESAQTFAAAVYEAFGER